jgi:hypothetical protein
MLLLESVKSWGRGEGSSGRKRGEKIGGNRSKARVRTTRKGTTRASSRRMTPSTTSTTASRSSVASAKTTPRHAPSSRSRPFGASADTTAASPSSFDKNTLYQRAVQSPKGELSWLRKFFAGSSSARRPAFSLREDFSGTSLLAASWAAADVRNTAVGLDLCADSLRLDLSSIG